MVYKSNKCAANTTRGNAQKKEVQSEITIEPLSWLLEESFSAYGANNVLFRIVFVEAHEDSQSCVKKNTYLFVVFLVVVFLVTAHEFVHTSGGIDKFHFAGIEGVRRVGDFHFVNRICFTIDFDGFFGVDRRTSDENVVVGHIFECDQTIIFGMYVFFHFNTLCWWLLRFLGYDREV